ncbi:glyoxylate/hydroxypyruvate reductase A [Ramlibacter sp. AW1]|uniref:Glyoxylate/hydroxypyruvate reductase A n=1 Tax=Ramlibacter aurantiacus TaxID=2801330 RepID=A0A937D4I0_9BURK|nr:glyoxylate/hydroxypyruvate reductase A [Ramlibacter aurantiacus]MBL0421745.1 glyoxylate/hydroxypyruvate reductase A [Ramlibacter aurantiacus]
MRISFCCTDIPAAPWLAGLRAALPEAEVSEWRPGDPVADHAVVWAPPQRFMDEQVGLRGLFNIGAGVDALLRMRLPTGTRIVRLDDAGMGLQMAEYVCQALIRHVRELDAHERDMRDGRWTAREPRRRAEFPVGILGLGVLGQRVARAVASFGFPVRGWSRGPRQLEGVECFAGPQGLEPFLAGTRVLACLLPLTPGTEGILDRRNLGRLLPGGYLINVARGRHLVEEDLLALLDSGHLAGATLDVFRTEPLPPEHPFWREPRLVLTPHVAAQTLRGESIAQIAGKIRALERGEPVAGLVDPTRGY